VAAPAAIRTTITMPWRREGQDVLKMECWSFRPRVLLRDWPGCLSRSYLMLVERGAGRKLQRQGPRSGSTLPLCPLGSCPCFVVRCPAGNLRSAPISIPRPWLHRCESTDLHKKSRQLHSSASLLRPDSNDVLLRAH
jgi:hypothetical protein